MPCLSILAVQQCFDSISCELCLEEKLRGKGDSPLAGNRRDTDKWSGPMIVLCCFQQWAYQEHHQEHCQDFHCEHCKSLDFFYFFSICFCDFLLKVISTRCSTPWRSHGGAKPYWFTSRWTVRTKGNSWIAHMGPDGPRVAVRVAVWSRNSKSAA